MQPAASQQVIGGPLSRPLEDADGLTQLQRDALGRVAAIAAAKSLRPYSADLFALRDGAGEEVRGGVPSTIPLIPAGETIVARDGRAFRVRDHAEIIANTAANYPDGIPVDFDHATEFFGGEAAGWLPVEALTTAPTGELVCDCEWTQPGFDAVGGRRYRYISPTLAIEPAEDGGAPYAIAITSAALTNNPALDMRALNHRQRREDRTMQNEQNETSEEQPQTLRALCGLPKEATSDQLFAAVAAFKAQTEPDLTHFVPREHFDRVSGELAQLKADKEAADAAAFTAERDREIENAIAEGKIPPAARDAYTAIASNASGLEQFRQLMQVTTPVIGKVPADAGAPDPDKVSAEDPEIIALANRHGLDPAKLAATRNARNGAGD